MSDDRYDKVTFHGHTVDKWTRQALLVCEQRLGYELTIVQGSYSSGVAASSGTHAGGGVVDLAPADHQRKVLELRQHGFAAWHRTELWMHGVRVWPEHIHAVLIGDEKASPSAQHQVELYREGYDGLVGNNPDNGPRVVIHEFVYRTAPAAPAIPERKPGMNHVEYGLQLIRAGLAELAKAPRDRTAVHTAAAKIAAIVKTMPKS